jgi:alkanesulfonate monooxygenase SsuD/methylene tetrahydromethanopterin reductase-like flavin-dependent oxidoreductase (luciferase family)
LAPAFDGWLTSAYALAKQGLVGSCAVVDVRFTVSFDMRAPAWGTPAPELYRAALEIAAYADRIGVDRLGVMEHHTSEDGYIPRPFQLGAAIAGVTERTAINLGAVILPLHDPIAIAEEIAVMDLISGGRARVIFGAGYVPSEFAMFGKSLHDRARLMDSGIAAILRALRGERFEFEGRPVCVRPLPTSAPETILMVGGGVPAAARRAARFDLGFAPIVPGLPEIYLAECERLGQRPRDYWVPVPGPMAIHLCEDPDRGWAAIERHAIHVITEYARWADEAGPGATSPFAGLTDPEALRRSGMFLALTPEQLLARVPELVDGQSVGFWPLLGGLDPAEAMRSMRLLGQVLPDMRRALAARD